jgi:hypothetical protein
MSGNVPYSDDAFDAFAMPIVEWVSAERTHLDIDQEFINDKVIPTSLRWKTCHAKCRNKRTRTHQDIVDKDAARVDFEGNLRKLIAAMKGSSVISEAQLKAFNISTDRTGPLNPPPTDEVELLFDLSKTMQVAVSARVLTTDPKAKPQPKPKGSMGVEYRYKIGGARVTDHNELPIVKIDTSPSSAFIIEVDDEALVNEEVQVTARFLSTTGAPGPWCPIRIVRIP